MRTTAVKEFTFESSHQLVGHCGKCANLHGHSYKLQVGIGGNTITEPGASDEGFVIDFTDLKAIVKTLIVDKLDHAFIAQGNEPTYAALKASGAKVVRLGFRTTCENMAQFIAYKLTEEGLNVRFVRLWETATGFAEVTGNMHMEPEYTINGVCDLD